MANRNVRYTDNIGIETDIGLSVRVFHTYRYTEISDIFTVYHITFTHHVYGEIIIFCFTQMQSKRSGYLHLKFL
jgi:hypothetical protein